MKCFSLLLGAGNTPPGGTRFSPEDEETIRRITLRHFPQGFTFLRADGGWFDPEAGRFREEESRQILVTARRLSDLQAWSDELGAALQQKELLVVEMGEATALRPGQRTVVSRLRFHGRPANR